MQCKKCGANLLESSFFCPNCHRLTMYPLTHIVHSLKGKWHILLCFFAVTLISIGSFLPFIQASALGYDAAYALIAMQPVAALMIFALGVTCFILIYQNQYILTRIFGCVCLIGVFLSFFYCRQRFSNISLYIDFSQIAEVGVGFFVLLFGACLILLSSLGNLKFRKKQIEQELTGEATAVEEHPVIPEETQTVTQETSYTSETDAISEVSDIQE